MAHIYNHLKTHTEEKKANKINICEVCNKNFLTKHNLDLHLEAAHKTVHCDQCDFSCVGTATLRGHRYKEHTEKSATKTKYPCHICGKAFASNYYLKEHILAHSGPQFQCEECDKSYNTEKSLYHHTIEIHREK